MSSGWQKKWARLTQMDWDEIRTRLVQAGHKRLDLASYRLGFGLHSLPLPAAKRSANFFFNAAELPRRVAMVREYLPHEAEKTVAQADAICRHEFDLLGYEKLAYGSDIDWHCDAVSGKRAPLKPWFKINFFDLSEVGDHKVTWELNRHQHLVTLAKTWCMTRDPRYVRELSEQWYSWRKANPYPLGINWASTLEVAFRTLSWLWLRYLMAGCDSLPSSFHSDLVGGLRLNGEYIERYLSTYFSPNTHLLGEALALFYVGTLCSEIPEAGRWQQTGWRILLDEAQRQVRPDGVYFEQALYYHVYALDFFLYARILAALNDIPIPQEFDRVLQKMLTFLRALAEGGSIPGFGDDDGGRLFDPRRNRFEHMTDPLLIGALAYDHDQYGASYALTEEAVWVFGDTAVVRLPARASKMMPQSHAFEAGGVYLLGDATPCPQQVMIDGGPQGIGHSGHGHADALSIRLSVNGQRVLIDPGTYAYMSESERDLFRGTAAHNTLRVDGVDQAVPAGPFGWSSIPHIRTERWLSGETFEVFVGSHDGYARLSDSVLHRRCVFHAKGGLWFIRDVMEGRETHLLETFWHFAPGLEVGKEHDAIIAKIRPSENGGDVSGIVMHVTPTASWKTEFLSAYDSPVYGKKEQAPAVCISARIAVPTDCAVLILPLTSASTVGDLSEFEDRAVRVRAYRYHLQGSMRYMIFSEGKGPWSYGPWSSDSGLLYCAVEDDRLSHVVMVSGSFVKCQDRHLFDLHDHVEHCEWLNGKFRCSNRGDVDKVTESNLEFLDSVLSFAGDRCK